MQVDRPSADQVFVILTTVAVCQYIPEYSNFIVVAGHFSEELRLGRGPCTVRKSETARWTRPSGSTVGPVDTRNVSGEKLQTTLDQNIKTVGLHSSLPSQGRHIQSVQFSKCNETDTFIFC